MYIYISIEDLVANALIELLEKSQKREVFFSELNRYGACVLQILNSQEEQAVLILSQEKTTEFLHDYSDCFESFNDGLKEGIRLKPNITVDDLWKPLEDICQQTLCGPLCLNNLLTLYVQRHDI